VRTALDGLIRLLGQFDAGEGAMTGEPAIRLISR
jgi:hypothetical protein